MLRGIYRHITAFLMALLVVFSTLSFAINSHYCGDTLVDSSWFVSAKTCGMETQDTLPPEHSTFERSGCCTDVVQLVEGQTELQLYSSAKLLLSNEFTVNEQFSFHIAPPLNFTEVPTFTAYSPPKLVRDICLLDEVFLI